VNGFITPPPGLLPSAPETAAPQREQVPAAPLSTQSFTTTPFGGRPPIPAAPVPPAPIPPVPVPAAGTSAPPEADATMLRGAAAAPSTDETVLRGGMPVWAPPPPMWTLRLPDRTPHDLHGATFVGRNPQPSEAAPDGAVLPLHDPAKSLSKTHALLVPAGEFLMVTDLHSTNGIAVVDSAGAMTLLEPGRTSPVPSGSTLQLGDYVVTVEAG